MESTQLSLLHEETHNKTKLPARDVSFLRRKRYFVAFMVFVAGNILSLLRVTLPIAIVDVTTAKNVTEGDRIVEKRELQWNSLERGTLLGCHFSLGLLSCLAGYISCKFGGTRVFGLSVFLCGSLSLLWPLSVHFSMALLIIIRMLEGVFFTLACSSIIEIFVKWAPQPERFRIVDFSVSGLFVGPVLAFPGCGLILEKLGWRYVFYFSGSVSIIWYVVWISFVFDNPNKDKFMRQTEKLYIAENSQDLPGKLIYPWKKILTSKAVWAFLNERFVEGWFLSFALDCLPTFIQDSYNVSISNIGFISVAPHSCGFLGVILGALIADTLHNKKVASLPNIYKTLITIGQLSSVSLLIVMGFWTSFMGNIFCMCLIRFMYSCSESAYTVMPIDIAGEYASVIQGFGVSMQTIGFLLNPIIVALIVPNHNSSEWSRYFLFLCIFNVWGAIIFFFFGSGRPEPWTEAGKKSKNLPDSNN